MYWSSSTQSFGEYLGFIRLIVAIPLAAILVLLISWFIVKEIKKWWNERQERRLQENTLYLRNLEVKMKQDILQERAEKRAKKEENIYEEI